MRQPRGQVTSSDDTRGRARVHLWSSNVLMQPKEPGVAWVDPLVARYCSAPGAM